MEIKIIPSEKEMENMLQNWQPSPSPSFENQMSKKPWQTPQRNWAMFTLASIGVAALFLVVLFAIQFMNQHQQIPVTFVASPSAVTALTQTPTPEEATGYIGKFPHKFNASLAPAQTPTFTQRPDEF